MNNFDVIIIGSGLGGLACGYILSKNGFKVGIFEKNTQIGGCLQSFKRDGVKFETGMHYIGSTDNGQTLNRFFNYFDIQKDVKFKKLDENAFDVISIQNQRFEFANGYENFIERLSSHFPNEYQSISEYTNIIKQVAQNSPLYSFLNIGGQSILNPKFVKSSVNELTESVTDNELLQNVLAGNVPLYAGIKDKTPLYIHALISDFYINSASRIIGSCDAIAFSLQKSIENFGGKIINNSEVEKINCDDEKAVSITLSNGETFFAKNIISNAHPSRTLQMLNTHIIRTAYRERIENISHTVSNFTVYIRFKNNKQPYMNQNFFHYNQKSVWGCENYTPKNWPLSFLYMHLCSSENQEFAEGAELIAYMRIDDVEKWLGTNVGKRGKDYEDFKKEKAEILLAELEKQMPGTLKNIQSYYTSSPLTYINYTATKEGSMYGILRDKNYPAHTLISQRTKIPNLFLTGQNINSHGILGVIIGSLITCAELIGMKKIVSQIKEANE